MLVLVWLSLLVFSGSWLYSQITHTNQTPIKRVRHHLAYSYRKMTSQLQTPSLRSMTGKHLSSYKMCCQYLRGALFSFLKRHTVTNYSSKFFLSTSLPSLVVFHSCLLHCSCLIALPSSFPWTIFFTISSVWKPMHLFHLRGTI